MLDSSPGPDLVFLTDIFAAQQRIRGVAVRTPLLPLDWERVRHAGFRLPPNLPEIFLKNEAAQPIGSFKLRGAFNKVAALRESEPDAFHRGVITFSSGNHAQGVAFAARALGTRAVIVMPENAPAVKRHATEALGAQVVLVGPASSERRQRAEELVRAHGYAMVPPYDDPWIIAGQATCGLEIAEQLSALPHAQHSRTLILSPVSGGGLLSGVAAGAKLTTEHLGAAPPHVWGCEPDLAADAHASFYSRQLVEWPAEHTSRTLADGLRTQSLGVRNFAHVLHYCDGIVTVSEAEIRTATRILLAASEVVAEPSGAVTLAAALFHAHQLPRADRIVAVVSGGNLDPALRAELQAENISQQPSTHV